MSSRVWIINAVALLIGVVLGGASLDLGFGDFHRPGPGFMPFLTGAALTVAASFALLKNMLSARREKGKEKQECFKPSIFNVVKTVGSLIIYVAMLPWLGYAISTFLLFVVLFKVAGFHRWLLVLMAAFLTVSISHIVFISWLGLRFPQGVLGL